MDNHTLLPANHTLLPPRDLTKQFYQCIIKYNNNIICEKLDNNKPYKYIHNSRLMFVSKKIPESLHKDILYFKMLPKTIYINK